MPDSPPQVNAFILCDSAFQQALTGKWCIIGTFGVIWGREFPMTHAPLVVFVSLSDFQGDCKVEVHIRNEEAESVAVATAQVPKLPLTTVEFPFYFPPVQFKDAGSYTLELLAGGQFLSARSFRVEKARMIDPNQPPPEPPPWLKPPFPGPTPPA